ncbi:MAG: pyridoxal-phosphate dependent enzyme [Flavobacteriales bacterium]|nr:pyridoxal-phosphate dependent enzyme [Flavobacteriales bacterium]
MDKFYLKHLKTGEEIDIETWYERCLESNDYAHEHFEVYYPEIEKQLINKSNLIDNSAIGMWKYFKILPLNNKKNIISSGEGNVALERWSFLEKIAEENFGINIKVYAHRHDNHSSTGTFKDLAGSMVASSLKEMSIKNYVVASTGNIATAFSRYLSDANINFCAFIPEASSKMQEAEIRCFGQKVYRIRGDYARAKKFSVDFANKNNYLLAAGTFDPLRIEAKKTMAYEWLRLLDVFPTAYIQGLSGGTGPIGVEKGCREMLKLGLINKQPKLLLAQSNKCAPMAQGYKTSYMKGFVGDWKNNYPIYENPDTEITTLATGNPGAYPHIADIVQKSNGFINEFDESKVLDIIKIVSFYRAVRVGPAAAVAIGGFFEALKNNHLEDQETVVINIGEGIRRSPEFMVRMIDDDYVIDSLDQCKTFDRKEVKTEIDSLLLGLL